MRLFACLFCLLFVFSCASDDGSVFNADARLEGEWTLTNVSCFCFFEEGTDFSQVKIIFDTNSNELTVTNTGEIDYFRSTGIYSFRSADNIIKLANDYDFIFDIKEGVLTLSNIDDPQIADDEVTYTFKR